MADSEEIRTTSVSLILSPKGIKLDEQGRIQFVNPEILQALVSGLSTEAAAADANYVQCVCNNYQCGKRRAEFAA